MTGSPGKGKTIFGWFCRGGFYDVLWFGGDDDGFGDVGTGEESVPPGVVGLRIQFFRSRLCRFWRGSRRKNEGFGSGPLVSLVARADDRPMFREKKPERREVEGAGIMRRTTRNSEGETIRVQVKRRGEEKRKERKKRG